MRKLHALSLLCALGCSYWCFSAASYSSLDSSWNGIKEQLTSEAVQTSRIASTLEQQALQPLQAFLINDLEKRFRATVSDSRKLLKDYFTEKAALQKSRDKYFRYSEQTLLLYCTCTYYYNVLRVKNFYKCASQQQNFVLHVRTYMCLMPAKSVIIRLAVVHMYL